MRAKQIIKGLNNSQKIRVIVNGVGFYTTVDGMTHMVFTEQKIAVWNALTAIANEKIQGYGYQASFYNEKNELTSVNVQVDLV